MVCLGNICRSPLAEGILKSKVNPEKITVDSAGTGHWHIGKPPDPRSIHVALKNGISISNQRGRQFSVNDFENYDYIFVMDQSNYQDLIALAQNQEHKNKVQLILDEIFPHEQVDVPDPYYGGNQGFNQVFELLELACTNIAKRLS